MENIIFYFSGTGNSLKTAKTVLYKIGNTRLVSMTKSGEITITGQYETIGFIFPIYFWGLPNAVIKFIEKVNFINKNSFYYSITTSGGSPGNGLSQLNELLEKHHNIKLNYGKNIIMQTNYILHNTIIYTYNFCNLKTKINKIIKKSDKELNKAIEQLKSKTNNKIKKMNRFMESYYKKHMKNISSITNDYTVSANCIKCGICVKVCPVKNIELFNDIPKFNNHCEHCLACIHYCPQKTINYKNITQNRKRYNHPEISCEELYKINTRLVQ
jgi:ferredoxin